MEAWLVMSELGSHEEFLELTSGEETYGGGGGL